MVKHIYICSFNQLRYLFRKSQDLKMLELNFLCNKYLIFSLLSQNINIVKKHSFKFFLEIVSKNLFFYK